MENPLCLLRAFPYFGSFVVATLASAQSPLLSPDSGRPQNGSGGSQGFTFVFSDGNGYQDLLNRGGHVLINTSPSGTDSCWVLFGSNAVRLAGDNPNPYWPVIAYGSDTIAVRSCAPSVGCHALRRSCSR